GRLRLRGILRSVRLGLGEVLEAEEDDDRKKTENQQGAHIAAATAAGAATLRLKIGILKFGQRKRPVVRQAQEPPLLLWSRFVGDGSPPRSRRHLVKSSAAEGVTAQQPPHGQRDAAQRAVRGDGH